MSYRATRGQDTLSLRMEGGTACLSLHPLLVGCERKRLAAEGDGHEHEQEAEGKYRGATRCDHAPLPRWELGVLRHSESARGWRHSCASRRYVDGRRSNGSGRRSPSRDDGGTGTGDTTPERGDEDRTSQVTAKLRIEERELEAGELT